jgi:large subunit ribosomal protein L22
MEARAEGRFIRVSPQKARLVVDLIRGRAAQEALSILQFTRKGIAADVQKILRSAIANATERGEDVDVDQLFVSRAYVNDGPRMKRTRPAPQGRAYRYQRRLSHIAVHVSDTRTPQSFVQQVEAPETEAPGAAAPRPAAQPKHATEAKRRTAVPAKKRAAGKKPAKKTGKAAGGKSGGKGAAGKGQKTAKKGKTQARKQGSKTK